MLRSQLECSLEANQSIQRQLDEVKQTTRLLDEQAITKAKQVVEEFAKIEPRTPRTRAPGLTWTKRLGLAGDRKLEKKLSVMCV